MTLEKRLCELSTFGIGGPAQFLAEARTSDEMRSLLRDASQKGISVFILGKGSNCLFDDRGYAGLVILNRIDYLHANPPFFTVGAGYSFARLGKATARMGWSGLEFASGIPATVGGAIFMNAGANGFETADVLTEVTYITKAGELLRLKKEELSFGYRTSIFQEWEGKGAIVEGVFTLQPNLSAKKTERELVDYRLKTQPYKNKSAGCAFRNPQGSSAGRLIEECGLKGYKIGGASVSLLHANFIVNEGMATAQDVLDLIATIKDRVFKEKRILLEEEIRYVPFSHD